MEALSTPAVVGICDKLQWVLVTVVFLNVAPRVACGVNTVLDKWQADKRNVQNSEFCEINHDVVDHVMCTLLTNGY